MEVSITDIAPLEEMVAEFVETIDSLDARRAVLALQTLERIQSQTNLAISLLKSQVLGQIDGQPVQIGRRKGKYGAWHTSTPMLAMPPAKWPAPLYNEDAADALGVALAAWGKR